ELDELLAETQSLLVRPWAEDHRHRSRRSGCGGSHPLRGGLSIPPRGQEMACRLSGSRCAGNLLASAAEMTTLEIRLLAYALLALILFGGSAWVGAHFTAKHYEAVLA